MEEEARRLCLRPRALRGGNRVRLLRDGLEAYPRMLESIESARSQVLLETYTFAEDAAGKRFARALASRAKEGVEVRVLYDSLGSRESSRELFGRMRSEGVRVVEFHPMTRFFRGLRYRRRNHRKLLVVDGRTAFVGGMNISREYLPPEEGGLGWRDTQVEIEGPLAADLAAMFRDLWLRESRRDPVAELPAPPAAAPGVEALAVSSHALRHRWGISRHYRHALRRARRRIWIANAYFLPSIRLQRILRKAARRNVDVRILVPARSDVPPVLYASQRLFAKMLRQGIRIFEWPGPMMHAKTAVVDGAWSTVGSYNLDHLSLLHNYELTAVFLCREFGRRIEEMFERDFGFCREVTAGEWRKRGWGRRFLEDFFYTFRAFF